MRCRAWTITTVRRTKGKGTLIERIKVVGDAYARMTLPQFDLKEALRKSKFPPHERTVMYKEPPQEGAALCGGEIKASVAARDEPYMGGTSATLEITYVCKRCGHTYHGPDLPDDADKLSEWLTVTVAATPDRED